MRGEQQAVVAIQVLGVVLTLRPGLAMSRALLVTPVTRFNHLKSTGEGAGSAAMKKSRHRAGLEIK